MSTSNPSSVSLSFKRGVRAWLGATRPRTLTAAFVPVAVGSACAATIDGFHLGAALAALLGAIFIQVGTNFVNDVADHESGADDERIGEVRAVAAGLISPGAMKLAAGVAFGLAALFGSYLIFRSGPTVLLIGVLSIAAGVAYTAGPFPLAYHGLGDVFVLAFFGFVAVAGATFVQAGAVPPIACLAAAPIGSLATVILAVNNLRDEEGDRKANKRTLVVRFGRGFGLAEVGLLLLVGVLAPLALAVTCSTFTPLLPLLTLPLIIRLMVQTMKRKGAELDSLVGAAGKLLFIYGVLLTIGIYLS